MDGRDDHELKWVNGMLVSSQCRVETHVVTPADSLDVAANLQTEG